MLEAMEMKTHLKQKNSVNYERKTIASFLSTSILFTYLISLC